MPADDRAESLKSEVRHFVEDLQDRICAGLEAFEPAARFREDLWDRPGGGGGRTRVLEGGEVFEKGGVNTSAVFGELPEELATKLPGEGRTFFATGVSLVLHPRSPMVPTVHANYRYIVQGGKAWFGGGADLTPYYLFEEDARHFHATHKAACDTHDPAYYPRFKAACDAYFFLPHRQEARGVGGLFFDGLSPDAEGRDLDALFAFVRSCGEAFLPAYRPLVEGRKDAAYGEAEKAWQLLRRGRYVEFNLIYDRGTLFGLKTQGRIESILMSLPPVVHYPYDPKPPGDRERALLDVVRHPRAWV
jgi:coproporphyrinogen III oxidase